MKKTLLLSSLVAALSTVSCFADPLMFAVKSTPYDHQMERIRPILTADHHSAATHVSIAAVNAWIADLRSIPYGFTRVWKTPAETESGAPADCKAKAVALYERMTSRGAKDVRLVIGHRTATSRQTHAWLAWETANGSYVLDPTFNYYAAKTTQVGRHNYEPLYVFDGDKKYRATGGLVAQN